MIISNNSLGRTLHALDLISEKHKALASNLANMHTPNYQRKDISFAQYLGGTANPLETKLAATLGPSPVMVQTSSQKIDAANELAEIQKNSMLYTIATRRMSSIITEMKTVINVGNG